MVNYLTFLKSGKMPELIDEHNKLNNNSFTFSPPSYLPKNPLSLAIRLLNHAT